VLTKADIQRLRSLREKKHREALQRFVVEGGKVIGELIAGGIEFDAIYATDDWQPAVAGRVPVTRISGDEMARISHFPTPSTVLAVGPIRRPALEPGALNRGRTLALDGMQDAGNVGTLLRIADWFGFDRVLLSPDCADLFHQKVINASMGSFARVPAFSAELGNAFASVAPAVPIVGCDLDGTSVYSLAPATDVVVVIGSEGRGLSAPVAARLTQRVTIPKFGGAESLNAAVAAGIVCAQLRRPSTATPAQ
jgi:TrmH family RNA methyltransferase